MPIMPASHLSLDPKNRTKKERNWVHFQPLRNPSKQPEYCFIDLILQFFFISKIRDTGLDDGGPCSPPSACGCRAAQPFSACPSLSCPTHWAVPETCHPPQNLSSLLLLLPPEETFSLVVFSISAPACVLMLIHLFISKPKWRQI